MSIAAVGGTPSAEKEVEDSAMAVMVMIEA